MLIGVAAATGDDEAERADAGLRFWLGAEPSTLLTDSGSISIAPLKFAPLADGRLVETTTTDVQRTAPRYSPDELGRCLRAFRVESAVLLKNGMQEFLFRA